MVDRSEHGIHRRVIGSHDIRFDGISDVLMRCQGAAVLDVGCNRGMAGYECAHNGAALVHGIDNYETGIATAREIFADMRNVRHRFEVVDLTGGEAAIVKAFGADFGDYDIVLLFAIYHKLERVMQPDQLDALFSAFARRCRKYICVRGGYEFAKFDCLFGAQGICRVQTSEISELGPSGIWQRESTILHPWWAR